MPIPESQLLTWSHQGSVAQSSTTYRAIKGALEAANAGYAGKQFEVFLQGSYANATNIFVESDVDVVIRLDSTFSYSLDDLSSVEQNAFQSSYTGSASYTYDNFKSDVLHTLQNSFGSDVEVGTKAIKVKARGSRRSTDIIAALEFRRYQSFPSLLRQRYDSGICFYPTAGGRIVNYPKQHGQNCTSKHQSTSEWFKPTVRLFKNIRGRLVEEGVIGEDIAPSYFLECMLYNVPSANFGQTFQQTVIASINWILRADRSKFVCSNELCSLLGNSVTEWPSAYCDQFLDAMVRIWRDWT